MLSEERPSDVTHLLIVLVILGDGLVFIVVRGLFIVLFVVLHGAQGQFQPIVRSCSYHPRTCVKAVLDSPRPRHLHRRPRPRRHRPSWFCAKKQLLS